MALPGGFVETLTRDQELVLSRWHPAGDAAPVLVLASSDGQPSPGVLSRLENEYALAAELDPAWAVRPRALVRKEGRTHLELEDPGGVPLERLLGQPLPLTLFLRLAVGLAAALGRLHRKGLVHKDIMPAHVLVNPATGDVHLTGFGRASRLPRERVAPLPPEVLAGTLAYMAPEQTGRMNRSIDARSDLYALGVTLYEMLTGVLPFTAADPLGWVHCHIAHLPKPPAERAPGVPAPLSTLVLKLLAKAPEERYQTAAGVEADLRRCRDAWERRQRINAFALGARDIPDQLLIPEKLYGREHEIAALLAAFERVASGGRPELVLVSGYAGIGKSSVVSELHKALVARRGLFASGKFDQRKRDVPYATLAQAFEGLVRQLLVKSDVELRAWRERLQEALGSSGKLLTSLIPALELVIGPQPSVPELPVQEQQNRFQAVFRRFLSAFAQAEHPLVLFVDDLQWLDAATLGLLEDLTAHSELRHLLLIGAYRDNEVSSSHPLMAALDAIRSGGFPVHDIVLGPLARKDLCHLVADALHLALAAATPLARLLHEKTDGNPFFAIQFLAVLAEDGLLRFDAETSTWTWDLEQIRARRYTDNVVDFMAAKLRRLPAVTREALTRLACLGNTVESATLAMVQGLTEPEVDAALWEAVRAGLLYRHGGTYRFLHDRIQEAAYAEIPLNERRRVHLETGRQLLAHMAADRIALHIFDIVDQFNRCAELLQDPLEKLRVAELNLAAGRKAKASAAYASARRYLAAGVALLEHDAWARRYDLAYPLWLERAECEFVAGHFDQAQQYLATLLEHGRSDVDKAAAYYLEVQLHVVRAEYGRAIESALAGLRLFGIDLPAHPTREQVQREYEQVWNSLGDRSIESLLEQPLMDDPAMNAAMRVMATLTDVAYFTDINLFALHLCRMVHLSLTHGPTPPSAHGHAWFGMILGPFFHRYREGYQFVRLGRDLIDRYNLLAYKARVCFCLQMTAPWTQPLADTLKHAADTLRAAVESGNLAFSCYAWIISVMTRLVRGEPLDEVWRETSKTLDFCRRCNFKDAVEIARSERHFIAQLREPGVCDTDEQPFDETSFEAKLTPEANSSLASGYWILKTQTRFLLDDLSAARAAAEKAGEILRGAMGMIHVLDYYYYAALTVAALYENASPGQQRQWRALLASHEAQLREWADINGPMFADRHALVAAEIARVEGRDLDALRLYEGAVQAAQENGRVHCEGIAHEVAARFYQAAGLGTAANAHLDEAHACFVRWGAAAKVRQLEKRYPQLSVKRGDTVTAAQLDLLSVAKASQAISGQIVLEELVDTLLRIVVENAGAQNGYLLLARGEGLILAAEARIDHGVVQVQRTTEAATALESLLPLSILNYSRNTLEPVLFADAMQAHPYAIDAYFARSRPRSVLCLPILRQSTLIGLLYLEHHHTAQAFTPDHLRVLELLAGQAAISLENARLYADLQRENSERRQAQETMKQLAQERENADRLAQFHQQLALHRAQYDELTRLPNRSKFRESLRELLADEVQRRQRFALVTVGLDRFSAINCTLGHKIGDSVLEETAARLSRSLPDQLLVARTGPDLFSCVIQIEPGPKGIAALTARCERLQSSLAAPLELGRGATLSASLGIALFPDHAESAEQLLQASDTALHRAKAQGRGLLQLFDPAMHQIASRQLALSKDLHRALKNERLMLHYQPIVSLGSGELLGVEALARWQREDGHYVPPDQFLPIAEAGDLLRPFTEWTLRTACQQMADWRRRGVPVPYLSINLSPAQMRLSHLEDFILEQIHEAGVPGATLTLEVTEGALLENIEAARDMLSRLRVQGLSVAVDDFGIGYASPHYLRALPVDVLKIDGSFLKDVPEDPEACSLLNGIIEIGRSLRLRVVSEVVETREQVSYLASRGVTAGQGHWFSRSLPPSGLEAWMQR